MTQALKQNGAGAANATRKVSTARNKPNPSAAALGIESSTEVKKRFIKIMFYGPTASRKTETVLRYFPNVFVFDAEGNTDQCVRSKEIPPFMRLKTQDSRKVLSALDLITANSVTMQDGSEIETVAFDSVSVIWSVQQEVAAALAEQRAQRGGRDVADANATPADWGKAKRPIKSILNRISRGSVRYIIFIARQKDLTETQPNGESKKIGLTWDAVKNTDFEMNLILRFGYEVNRWFYAVEKVQGELKEIFPLHSKGYDFPMEKLAEYAAMLDPNAQSVEDDDDLAEQIASDEIQTATKKTSSNLIAYATSKGFDAKQLGVILKENGIFSFDPSRWDAMVNAVDEAVLGSD